MSKNPQPLTTKQELLLAAELVRTRSWKCYGARRTYGSSTGLCLMEAIAVARGLSRNDWDDIDPPPALGKVCRDDLTNLDALQVCFCDRAAVTVWNDLVCDGGDMAVRLLESAAEACA